jgi:hypothetical protein
VHLWELEAGSPTIDGSMDSVDSVGSYPDSVRDTDNLEAEINVRERGGGCGTCRALALEASYVVANRGWRSYH